MRGIPGWVAPALPVLAVLAVSLVVLLRPVQVLPRAGLAPGFALATSEGATTTSEDLRGAIVLYSFVGGCDDPCAPVAPLVRAVQARLPELGAEAPPVRLVTITVDPAQDPAVTAARLGAEPAHWTVLGGEPTRLKQVVGSGFGVFYGPAADGRVAVEPALRLVDGWGIVRAEYRAPLPSAERVLRDLRLVTDEARASTGAARLAYETAHLLACYAP